MGVFGVILVVVPDTALRRSLVFLLEGEGFQVLARETYPPPGGIPAGALRCAVVDEEALALFGPLPSFLAARRIPAIWLTTSLAPVAPPDRSIPKPMLGAALVDVVFEVVAARQLADT